MTIEAMIELIESTANFMRGMTMDPRIPTDTRQALIARASKLDAAASAAITQAEQAGDDTARLDWLQSVARCDPKMDGNHVWWPLSFNVCSNIKGPNIRAAIDSARGAGEV